MRTKRERSIEEIQAFAISHSVRIEALTVFNERVASPSDLVEALGITLNQASYHVRMLRDAQCIELVDTQPRGGSHEHFYRATVRPEQSDEDWQATPESGKRKIAATIFRNLTAEVLSAIRAGTLTKDPLALLSWKSTNLDTQGQQEAADEQRESLERLASIEARAAERMVDSGEKGVSVVLGAVSFRRSRFQETKLATGEV